MQLSYLEVSNTYHKGSQRESNFWTLLTLESPAQLCEAQIVICDFEAGPPQLLKTPQKCL